MRCEPWLLPTEAEWEYAAAGDDADAVARHDGNVWEWTADQYEDSRSRRGLRGPAPATETVFRLVQTE